MAKQSGEKGKRKVQGGGQSPKSVASKVLCVPEVLLFGAGAIVTFSGALLLLPAQIALYSSVVIGIGSNAELMWSTVAFVSGMVVFIGITATSNHTEPLAPAAVCASALTGCFVSGLVLNYSNPLVAANSLGGMIGAATGLDTVVSLGHAACLVDFSAIICILSGVVVVVLGLAIDLARCHLLGDRLSVFGMMKHISSSYES